MLEKITKLKMRYRKKCDFLESEVREYTEIINMHRGGRKDECFISENEAVNKRALNKRLLDAYREVIHDLEALTRPAMHDFEIIIVPCISRGATISKADFTHFNIEYNEDDIQKNAGKSIPVMLNFDPQKSIGIAKTRYDSYRGLVADITLEPEYASLQGDDIFKFLEATNTEKSSPEIVSIGMVLKRKD